MAVADHTGQAWLQGFNDAGQAVFNMTADELMEIKVCFLRPITAPLNLHRAYRSVTTISLTRSSNTRSEPNTTLAAVLNRRHST